MRGNWAAAASPACGAEPTESLQDVHTLGLRASHCARHCGSSGEVGLARNRCVGDRTGWEVHHSGMGQEVAS